MIEDVIRTVGRTENAKALHKAVASALVSAGFYVKNEYQIELGRIDVYARSPEGDEYGIELDRVSARWKSIKKLKSQNWTTVIVLRDGAMQHTPGIDITIGLGDRIAKRKRF